MGKAHEFHRVSVVSRKKKGLSEDDLGFCCLCLLSVWITCLNHFARFIQSWEKTQGFLCIRDMFYQGGLSPALIKHFYRPILFRWLNKKNIFWQRGKISRTTLSFYVYYCFLYLESWGSKCLIGKCSSIEIPPYAVHWRAEHSSSMSFLGSSWHEVSDCYLHRQFLRRVMSACWKHWRQILGI